MNWIHERSIYLVLPRLVLVLFSFDEYHAHSVVDSISDYGRG